MTPSKRTSLIATNYTGHIEDTSILQRFLCTDLSNQRIPVTHLFIAHYHAYPCTVIIQASTSLGKLHVPSIRRYLEIDHKHNSTEDIIKREYHPIVRSFYITNFLANLGNGIMIDCENCQLINDIENPNKYKSDGYYDYFLIVEKLRINYLPEHDIYVNDELASKLSSFYVLQSKSTIIQVVCKYPQQGYYLHGINIKKPFIYDLSLSYGKDFIIIHHQILKQLNKIEWKGIILLYGIPGTGKTYYIRYLINELQEKNLIYFPSDIIRVLSSSEILQILKPYSHSIIIIDDAENLNKDHPDQVLNNLFNLNHLSHRPIIATFNSYLPQIFSHHKTSSIIQYSFNKLDIINSRILLKTLGSQRDNETIKQSMTLGEIYAQITFETKIQNENIIESRKKLKTPDEMIQLLAEQELSLSDKDNCTLS
ncbi:unnamed protein product [Rotaria sordida]|uniref:ATPase AAA-type core domain-containing protein n=1 Tax=Rotaria sordida TaxID=392033 RepID=A0A814UZC5_9BILA|nr:unnamed protein product [Rotaria sordida]CAF1260537.1 unnamed protein product [Rotaria sordida]CAF1540724.1 unnamed protein product [Rotaria sordida]CAF3492899.1 unnamed protein product [Rotaria sordida]